MTHNFERLREHILPLSKSKNFEAARVEWILESVEVSDEFDSCPCGQDIKEHCYILNKVTGHRTYVGNVCVNRFIGIDTGSLFDGLRRIRENSAANPNLAVIAYAEARGFLFEKEPDFLRATVRKRVLSSAQKAWKEKINRRILQGTVVRRRTVR
ncbi:hypothetical protein DF107_26835 [Burkholderia stagnalis]|uniref:hypothetical protein n=1 Tax=Burkholderia stagnalis TaxID=1503054 RepID=UPI000F5824EA|nr:hypothetical protein [Burkholderia stagnalis]RQQ02817.1 hypothetical protein DF164_25240 [Burkholderia stagnalis]RQQ11138.1 hypothetical protein DF161_24730 [Burkholderia stagnalis]RQQ26795.1 hypothetical protein DF163_20550 [Burkholderia stagnalis]RQQ29248.1 hypothetical protein DF148_24550 [Burkholderia stagnalis]RQQ29993.1 hypothetical protein DF149_18935 [Burkholderia stagnalis]